MSSAGSFMLAQSSAKPILWLTQDHLIVVLRSTRAIFIVAALYERSVHRPLYCGDNIKVACLWIQGKMTSDKSLHPSAIKCT